MPGSPPISSAEPGTKPPPVTRSNSALPLARRRIGGARALPKFPARARDPSAAPARGPAGEQRPPPQRGCSTHCRRRICRPSARKRRRSSGTRRRFAAGAPWRSAHPLIDAVHALTKPSQELITDGAGAVGQIINRDARSHRLWLDPGSGSACIASTRGGKLTGHGTPGSETPRLSELRRLLSRAGPANAPAATNGTASRGGGAARRPAPGSARPVRAACWSWKPGVPDADDASAFRVEASNSTASPAEGSCRGGRC